MGLPGWKRHTSLAQKEEGKNKHSLSRKDGSVSQLSSVTNKDLVVVEEEQEPQDSLADFCNEYPVFVFHPYEPIRLKWDMTVMAVMLYVLLDIPVRICFSIDLDPNHPWEILNLLVDIFFLCDIVFNFHTGFIRESQFITDKGQIAKRYLSGWFWIDLVTSIPFSRIAAALPETSGSNSSLTMLPRLLRFMKIARMFKLLRVLKLMKMMSNWEEQDSGSAASLRLLKFLCIVFLMAHIAGCMWMGVATLYRTEPDEDGLYPGEYLGYHEDSWPVRHDFWDKNKLQLYLYTLYWAFTTLTTVGYGDITALLPLEVGWTITIMMLGTSLFGYIIGNVASLMTHEDETAMLVKAKIQSVLAYMRYREFPDALARKIRRHYEYSWKRSQVYNEEEILSELPHTVRTECALHIHKDTIAKVPFLADLGEDVVPLLVTRLRPMLAAHGDLIVREGMFGDEMFFVAGGALRMEVQVWYNAARCEEVLVRKLHVGEYFAEYAVIMDQPKHPVSVRAAAYCDLFMLNQENFHDFGEVFPEVYMKVIRMGRERFMQLMKELNRRKTQHIMSLNIKRAKMRDEERRRLQRATPRRGGSTEVAGSGGASSRALSETSSSESEEEGGPGGGAPRLQPGAVDSVVPFPDRLRYHREHRERLEEGRTRALRRQERAAKREAAERRRAERAKALARPADGRELERQLHGVLRGVGTVARAALRLRDRARSRAEGSLAGRGAPPRAAAAAAPPPAGGEAKGPGDDEEDAHGRSFGSSKIVPMVLALQGDSGRGRLSDPSAQPTASLNQSMATQDLRASSDRPLLAPSPVASGYHSDGSAQDAKRHSSGGGLFSRLKQLGGARSAGPPAERAQGKRRGSRSFRVPLPGRGPPSRRYEGVETGRERAPVLLTAPVDTRGREHAGEEDGDADAPPPSRCESQAAEGEGDASGGRSGRKPRQGIMLQRQSSGASAAGLNLMSKFKTGLHLGLPSNGSFVNNSMVDPEELARAQELAQQRLMELAAEEARPKFSFWVMMRIQIWKQKAQLAVAMRKMNVVELRHQQKYAGGGGGGGGGEQQRGSMKGSQRGMGGRGRRSGSRGAELEHPSFDQAGVAGRLDTLTVQQAELRIETRALQLKLGTVEDQLAASASLLAAIAEGVGVDLAGHSGPAGPGGPTQPGFGRQVSAPVGLRASGAAAGGRAAPGRGASVGDTAAPPRREGEDGSPQSFPAGSGRAAGPEDRVSVIREEPSPGRGGPGSPGRASFSCGGGGGGGGGRPGPSPPRTPKYGQLAPLQRSSLPESLSRRPGSHRASPQGSLSPGRQAVGAGAGSQQGSLSPGRQARAGARSQRTAPNNQSSNSLIFQELMNNA